MTLDLVAVAAHAADFAVADRAVAAAVIELVAVIELAVELAPVVEQHASAVAFAYEDIEHIERIALA